GGEVERLDEAVHERLGLRPDVLPGLAAEVERAGAGPGEHGARVLGLGLLPRPERVEERPVGALAAGLAAVALGVLEELLRERVEVADLGREAGALGAVALDGGAVAGDVAPGELDVQAAHAAVAEVVGGVEPAGVVG